MLPAVSCSASLYNHMKQMLAAHQRQPAVAEENALPPEGSARSAAREQTLTGERPDALTPQYIGPARKAARSEALGSRQLSGIDMAAYYRNLAGGLQAGPKPASALAAEANYLAARKAI